MKSNLLNRIGLMRGGASHMEADAPADEAPAPATDEPTAEPEKEAAPAVEPDALADEPATDEPAAKATPGQVAAACAEAGLPHMADELVSEGLTIDQVKERLGGPAQVRAMVGIGRKINGAAIAPALADQLVKAGHTPATAGLEILSRLADAQAKEVKGRHDPDAKAQAGHGWDAAIAAVGGKK